MAPKNGTKMASSTEKMDQQLNMQMVANIGFKTTNSIEKMVQQLNMKMVVKLGTKTVNLSGGSHENN